MILNMENNKEPEKSKTTRKHNAKCSRGHDISIVGRTKSRNCKQCLRDYQAIRREFIKKNFPKQP
jgi:hypothetical protein